MQDIVLVIPMCEGPIRKAFETAGVTTQVVGSTHLNDIARVEPENGFDGALVDATSLAFNDAMGLCRQLRQREQTISPIILVLDRYQLDELTFREDLFDDFVVAPVDASELAARLHHRLRRAGHEGATSLVEQGGLMLNLETYQATISGRVMDLTYMEYELLKFLATNPQRVFSRETLLNRVWGYEYYGGARTVDVHVRRLRAKLGEEHAYLIQTVRSVGYKFGANNSRTIED
jgi:DNA-binding response OmpR family regulator